MTKARRQRRAGPSTMVFVAYPHGMGRSVWMDNAVADKLVKSLKKPAKRAAGNRPAYIVRCYPHEERGETK